MTRRNNTATRVVIGVVIGLVVLGAVLYGCKDKLRSRLDTTPKASHMPVLPPTPNTGLPIEGITPTPKPAPTEPPYEVEEPEQHPVPTQWPSEAPKDENHDEVITPDGELVDEDGNDVHDMTQGDLGIYTAKATMKKVTPKNTDVNAMIAYAKKYMGKKYEYGSNRNTDTTFDCSDFTQWVYRNTLGMQLPMDSRSQKEYVRQFGTARWTDWHKNKPGDLMFFSSYRGTKKSDYADVKRNVTTITHVGIYLGDGNIIHTASNPTGVRIQNIAGNHLEWRLVYNGRPY